MRRSLRRGILTLLSMLAVIMAITAGTAVAAQPASIGIAFAPDPAGIRGMSVWFGGHSSTT